MTAINDDDSADRPRPRAKAPRAASRKSASAPRETRWAPVAKGLESQILSGKLVEGQKLPSEKAIAAEFGVNRHAVRRAIAELVRIGLVRNLPQLGSEVLPIRKVYKLGPSDWMIDAIKRQGLKPGYRLVSLKTVQPEPAIARLLEMPLRAQVVVIDLVRLSNDLPISYVTASLRADRFGNMETLLLAAGSIRQAIARSGMTKYKRRSSKVSSRPATPEEARHLEIKPGEQLLVLETVDVDLDDDPICHFTYRLDASRSEFLIAD